MNGPHDLGGMDGFGPVVIEENEPVFHEDWERRVFGVSYATWGRIATVDEFRYGRERMPPVRYLASSYYEKWIATLETILVEKGIVTAAELEEARMRFELDTGAQVPSRTDQALVERLVRLVYEGGSGRREIASEPRYAVGDHVVTRNIHPIGHTRLPRYVRGRRCVIERVHEAFVLPDTVAVGKGENPEYVYTVRFDARELWGESAEPNTDLRIDLWESYLLPLSEQD
jgi:nitrile hydratase beta subunit